jgi:predicted double-glycine peptidase
MGLGLSLLVLPLLSPDPVIASQSISKNPDSASAVSLQLDTVATSNSTLEFDETTENTDSEVIPKVAEIPENTNPENEPPLSVPFYSQFTDISRPEWRKVGCGIASLAMVIDYYTDSVSVDTLLQTGIARNAYLDNAGWIHAGLIDLASDHGLTGQSVSLAGLSKGSAFTELKEVLAEGPVMASVHYTFEPTNPIPHLVVINEVKDGLVYYNDPAEPTGGGSLTIDKFLAGWKQRYIEIRPAM